MIRFLMFSLCFFLICGCDKGADSPRGFSLPEGNSDRGRIAFVDNRCSDCHSIEGLQLGEASENRELNIIIGGQSPNVKTYADIVTSIINPSHRVLPRHRADGTDENGQSKMRVYNDVLTVTELIDLVAFLQPKYEFMPYYYTRYRAYP
ncbi:MAG: c-type cytochrome [Pseudomonadales bacterium]